MTDVLAKLVKEAAQVFPVEYRDVELIGGPIAGTIPGFGFIENKTDMFIGALSGWAQCLRFAQPSAAPTRFSATEQARPR
jgi:hypothetical protein